MIKGYKGRIITASRPNFNLGGMINLEENMQSSYVYPIVPLTGTYYSNYNTIPGSLAVTGTGVAKIVLNGYGLLLYGWQTQATGTSMHALSLPNFLLNRQIDITFIGGGGYHYGGGGGGGAGAGGGRHLTTLSGSTTVYLKTGTHYYSPTYWNTNTIGVDEWRNTRLYISGTDNLYGPHAGESTGSNASGGNVYNYVGPSYNSQASISTSGTNLAYIQSVDPTFQYCYGGAGVYLQGFGTGYPNGSDLGGGGGAQDYVNYGGSSAAGTGGRYGYAGGLRGAAGNGPVGGVAVTLGTYRKGAGGSFGGGVGDAGNDDTTMTPGGGAILIRWDTTLATFQSGRPGWP